MNVGHEDIREFMAANLAPFQPLAYFDKHMDCVRVLIQDVSVTEVRLNEFFTLARSNSGVTVGRNVGFTIKGIAHLFKEIGIPVSGVHDLVAILDRIVKTIPHTAVKRVSEEFMPVLLARHLSVDFGQPELLAA